MSRYRDDRDSDYYGGRFTRGRAPGGYEDDRGGMSRGDYGDEERGRMMPEMDDYGRYGEREPYGYTGRSGRGDEQRRSSYDEGRDYYQPRMGRERHRGASRSHVRCRDIMTRDVTVATRDTTLEGVARMMRDEDTGVIPVVDQREAAASPASPEAAGAARRGQGGRADNGILIGLITDRDIVIRAIAEGKDPHTTRAEEIMTEDIHTAQPNDRVIDVIRKMGDKQVRRIPVVDREGTLRGIISMADVALETEEDRELADALEEISSGSSFWNRIFG